MSPLYPAHSSSAGHQGEHQALVPEHDGVSVHGVSAPGQLQEAAVLAVLLPLGAAGAAQVPAARLEHPLRIQ